MFLVWTAYVWDDCLAILMSQFLADIVPRRLTPLDAVSDMMVAHVPSA